MEGTKEIRNHLSPEWIRDCVMVENNQCALVISPTKCLENGITNVKLTKGRFGSKTIMQIRLDFNYEEKEKEEWKPDNEQICTIGESLKKKPA